MSWLLLATIGQLLNAIVAFLDKYIVTDEKALPKPFVYAFYSCLLTGFWGVVYLLAYIPGLTDLGLPSFGNVQQPTIQVLGIAFLAAYTFFMALVSMYDALKHSEAVNVMPVIGAVSTLSTFGLSYLLLSISLSTSHIWGVVVLALGTLLVAQTMPKRDIIFNLLHSGVFFALHVIAMKGLFLETSFDDGFFWSRVCFVLFALSLLMIPAYFDKVNEQTERISRRTSALVIFTKVLAGIAAFLILKATDIGNVAVVQALDGLKFVFILLATVALGGLLPDTVAQHEARPKEVFRHVLYVAVIAVGYFILFL